MGLDDFTGEPISDEKEDRVRELSKEHPPEKDSKWSNFEPGTPNWLSFISGDEVENNGLPTLEHGVDDITADTVVVINIDGVRSTSIISDEYVNLESYL